MPDPSGSDRLTGWKEIASYLRKSVRAAQRWERDMGLPVHRVRTPSGQSIYARKSEIDVWLKRSDAEERSELERRANVEPVRTWLRRGLIGAGAIVVAAAILLVIVNVYRVHAEPVTFVIGGRVLRALDDNHAEVWRYTFEAAPERLDIRDRPRLKDPIRRADVDGDGIDEVLAVIHMREGPKGASGEALYCWNLDGTLLWKYAPAFSLTFGARTFVGPWRILDAVVAPATHHVWASLSPHIWWGGAIVGIDSQGHGTLQFAHAGLFYTLIYTEESRLRYLLASGVNNAAGQAAIAAIDLDAPPGSWPQRPGSEFTCTSCPRGTPAAYILLPRTEVNQVSAMPYSVARTMTLSNNVLQVDTEESADGIARAVFRIDRGLTQASFSPADGYWTTHQRFQAEGKLDHDARDCPQLRQPLIGRRWTPESGWQDLAFKPSGPAVPASERF